MAAAIGMSGAAWATTTFTFGYLIGSVLGAPLADKLPESSMLTMVAACGGAGAIAMWPDLALPFLIGTTLVGLTFGGAGSILPVLVGRRYGTQSISAIYGRMILAYGLAGLIAPWLAGVLFETSGSYGSILALCGLLSALSFAASRLIPMHYDAGS